MTIKAIIAELRPIIYEMRCEGVAGWPNALSDITDRLAVLSAQHEQEIKALKASVEQLERGARMRRVDEGGW